MKFGWGKLFNWNAVDVSFFDSIEEKLIEADAGGSISAGLSGKLKLLVKERGLKNEADIRKVLEDLICDYFPESKWQNGSDELQVILMAGVNGVGKTTTIAKLTRLLSKEGTVILGAGDTWRAAAREQLEEWGRRLNVKVIGQAAGSDPASVAFDTVQSALASKARFAIIDTAGRMHTNDNLLDELTKIRRVLTKFEGKCRVRTLLIIDAATGRSAIDQARVFKEKASAEGLILTKLDTQARGGALLAISDELKLPVYFMTFGENIEAIAEFDRREFARSLTGENA